jgi:hypothetical protein
MSKKHTDEKNSAEKIAAFLNIMKNLMLLKSLYEDEDNFNGYCLADFPYDFCRIMEQATDANHLAMLKIIKGLYKQSEAIINEREHQEFFLLLPIICGKSLLKDLLAGLHKDKYFSAKKIMYAIAYHYDNDLIKLPFTHHMETKYETKEIVRSIKMVMNKLLFYQAGNTSDEYREMLIVIYNRIYSIITTDYEDLDIARGDITYLEDGMIQDIDNMIKEYEKSTA